jgi:hypothetical protein
MITKGQTPQLQMNTKIRVAARIKLTAASQQSKLPPKSGIPNPTKVVEIVASL